LPAGKFLLKNVTRLHDPLRDFRDSCGFALLVTAIADARDAAQSIIQYLEMQQARLKSA